MEKSYQEILARFCCETTFYEIPKEVVNQTKRLILDTVGCAIGGYSTDISKKSVALVKSLGGVPESTILVSGDKTSCTSSAFANTKMAYALDFDDCFYGSPHFGTLVVMASLAVGERTEATGKDFILGVAVGYDVAARIGRSIGSHYAIVNSKIEPTTVSGFGWWTFGAAAAASKILKLTKGQIIHALGIAGANAPMPSRGKCLQYGLEGEPLPLMKYFDSGWAAQVGVTAALCAQIGFTGFPTIIDGENGFWKMCGAPECRFDFIEEKLGEKWYVMDSAFKPYPCCRFLHHPMYLLARIIEEHDISPQEIERIKVKVIPIILDSSHLMSCHPRGVIDLQFSLPYNMAMVALRRKPGPSWHSLENINSKTENIMRRIRIEPHERASEVFAQLTKQHQFFKKIPTSIEVTTSGETFKDSLEYTKGDPWDPQTRMSNRELKDKFMTNVVSVSDSSAWRRQAKKAIEIIFNLEELEDVKELTNLLSINK